MMKTFPQWPVSEALLVELAKVFPDQLPDKPIGAEETARLIGQQDVIRKLRAEFKKQNT